MPKVVVLPGDGVGPEVVSSALEVLKLVAPDLEYQEFAFGLAGIEKYGVPLADEVLEAAQKSDAVLMGSVGGLPGSTENVPREMRPESGLLKLRKGLGVYANLRPSSVYEGLEPLSPLKPEIAKGVDVLILRELLGGAYFGEPRSISAEEGYNTIRYNVNEVARAARWAFEAARTRKNRVCSVDKANVMEVSEFWRREVQKVHDLEFPDVELTHEYADSCAMLLVKDPKRYDVIVTENLFGDFLSDLASVLPGSLGLLPSASLGDGTGLYEPIHGSAPDIAGMGVANPAATILSAAMMLRYSFKRPEVAARVEAAVKAALFSNPTRDLGGTAGTREFTDAVLKALA
jgi:3-isopropylmalate dehydrogenase